MELAKLPSNHCRSILLYLLWRVSLQLSTDAISGAIFRTKTGLPWPYECLRLGFFTETPPIAAHEPYFPDKLIVASNLIDISA
jgi:hypothetical protein